MGESLSERIHRGCMALAVVLPLGPGVRVERVPRDIPAALRDQLPMLVAAMRADRLPDTTRVGAMASYHLGWTEADGRPRAGHAGKLLRGGLALWLADALVGDPRRALPVATAVEWIHNFTLVHDDIQDEDRERRHRPTVWAVWGAAQAINAGDGMHALALRSLLEGRDHPAHRLRAAAALNRAVLAVIEGQCLDLALEGRIDASSASYRRLVRAKTGALIGAALESSALMCGADACAAEQLRKLGIELGVVFQIRDDWLGTWGDSTLTGKGCRGDVARRKLTYPVIVAHTRLEGAARRELRQAYTHACADEHRIYELLDQAGAREQVMLELDSHRRAALDLTRDIGLSQAALEVIEEVVTFAAERSA